MRTRILYLIYRLKWRISHRGKAFGGMNPVCFREWLCCEYANRQRGRRGQKM